MIRSPIKSGSGFPPRRSLPSRLPTHLAPEKMSILQSKTQVIALMPLRSTLPCLARLAMLAPACLVVVYLSFGLFHVISLTLRDGGIAYLHFLARRDYLFALIRTIELSVISTLICALIGYPLALYIHQYKRNKSLLLILVVAPWLVSIVVRSYGWVVILGSTGLINSALLAAHLIDSPLKLIFNGTGIVIGMVHVFLPFMVFSILAVLGKMNASLVEASMSLRAGPASTFFRVVLPLSLPGVLSGAILVFLSCTGAVVTPLLLGGLSQNTLGSQIYVEIFSTFDFPKASTLAVVLVLTSGVVALPLIFLERSVSRWQR